ncbi:hypothetical protein MSAN_01893000 [Mycena sanguinolenta]|uniref:Uncharacterized protein n=1 Tax=Mycena sanguinolenta TaxID=230812 RepID=A0A8H6XQ99_9AGAR|nr:hypothetical protein MSAN_01893000 [Mycena sanguinolenta]
MPGPSRNIRAGPAKPYARTPLPKDTLVDQLNRLAAKEPIRFDLNATATTGDTAVAICFTREQLNSMENPILVGKCCVVCHLVVALWGFGWYILDKDDNTFDITHFICKACWRFSDSNPRFDNDDAEVVPQIAPPCTCPPGSMACQDDLTGCELHNVPALTRAPAGCKTVRRPKMRAEVAEDVDKLVKRCELELEDIHKRWDVVLNQRPFDVEESDKLRIAAELATKKLQAAWELRDTFRCTRLAAFKMPPPFPLPA